MIMPVPMELVSVMVRKERSDEVASRLVELGVFHPVDIRHIEAELGPLAGFQIEKEAAGWDNLQSRIRDILRKTGLDLSGKFGSGPGVVDYSRAQAAIEALEKKINPLFKEKDKLEQELVTGRILLSQAKEYLPFPIADKALYSFLVVSTGKIEEKNIPLLEKNLPDSPHVLYPFKKEGNSIFALFIALRRDKVIVENVLEDMGWQKIEYPKEAGFVSQEAQDKIGLDIVAAQEKIENIDAQLKNISAEHAEELTGVNYSIRVNRALLEAKKYGCLTEKTALLSGWVPRDRKEEVRSRINSLGQPSYVEFSKAEGLDIPKDEIPVKCRHHAIFKPFELLVDIYGMPRYGTVDPTIFVGICFLLMFGAMFGDIGHGLALFLMGLALGIKVKSKAVKPISTLLMYAGASAMAFGGVYGSFFGIEFKSVWIKPIENIMDAVQISIYFGIVMISLGIAINIFNCLRDRDFTKLLSDRAGIIGGMVYWVALASVVKFLSAGGPIPGYYSLLIFSGLLILFLYPLVDCIARKKTHHLAESFVESAIGLLEFFTVYLANTVSFIRVAAFALAHTGLFIAIFSLAGIVRGNGIPGDIASWTILILGNIMVIGMEGMVVTIQSLRLNYYEFFSKFFVSGKTAYKPVVA